MKNSTTLKSAIAGVTALVAVALAAPAGASPITTNTWYTFGFNGTGSALAGPVALGTNPASLAAPDAPWTISLAGPANLTITDLEISGDYFTLYDNGVLLGTSDPGVPNATNACNIDISCALADSNYGKGTFLLGAGDHSITGIFEGVIGYGDGAFTIAATTAPTPAPEPMTLAIFGAGLLGAAAATRRQKKV
jgi:hypothetical protein